ncbi:MAG: DnaJ domain-containing protein [Ignavibacteria bacterium]|nr:DnaJ domain-containing protein [Ignavibacteria bacterium]
MKIRKIRAIADDLFERNKYEEAFYLYDEIYSRIWSAIGTIQNGLNDFSSNFLGNSYQSYYKLKNNFTLQAAETVFKKWFDLDVDQTLNELTFTTFGHVQCICYSPYLNKTISADVVYLEFLVLQTLINEGDKDDWLNHLFKIATPVSEDMRLKKIRCNITDSTLKKLVAENAEKLKTTDWRDVNICILDYLLNMGDNFSDLYLAIKKIVGTYFRQKTHRNKKTDKKEKSQNESYKGQNYERHEKYERYEKYENASFFAKDTFDATRATDFEKTKYYSQVLGLTGKVSKASIRKKYLELIAQYHPDKVFELGEELKILAEIKTKQLNAAYDWMKKKYTV